MRMRDAAWTVLDILAGRELAPTDNGSTAGFSASIKLEVQVSCIPAKRRQFRPTGATAVASSSSSSSPSCSRAQPPLSLLPP